MLEIEERLTDQIRQLAVIQYLIWLKERPEDVQWQAVETSLCYWLLGLPYGQKVSGFTLALMRQMIANLAKKYDLPADIGGLKALERSFRLELDGKKYAVSDCSPVNDLLRDAGSSLRLCSGFYGSHKFYLLGEAAEKQVHGKAVYRVKKELAVTPGCHLLMAALVGGQNIFLRESSVRFVYYHKWSKEGEDSNLRLHKGLLNDFMDNLFYHELNHSSIESYIKDEVILGLSQASAVMGPNILIHLQEIFTDWLPASPAGGPGESASPLLRLFEKKDLAKVSRYAEDNWFYGSSFPEQEIFTSLWMAPIARHGSNWAGLIKEATDRSNGSLLNLYLEFFEDTAKGLKKIIEGSVFVLTDREVNYRTVSIYLEADIKAKNKGIKGSDYQTTYWSNMISYLKKFSPGGYKRAAGFLEQAEKELERKTSKKLGVNNLKEFVTQRRESCLT